MVPSSSTSIPSLLRMAPLALALAVLTACSGSKTEPEPPPVAHATFAVFSDPHVHDVATLGASGPEFEADQAMDRKMWKESAEILDAVITDLKAKPIDFVLVPGDLTKDGEWVNHQLMASKLAQLRAAGKQVLVVPGNHDVNNPDGRNYTTTPATSARRTTASEFKALYGDCGYNGALYTDPNSLSYVAEPVRGVWVFALDSCRWAENTTAPITAGAIGAASRAWIVERLQEAKVRQKTVIGMMHHGIVEHFAGQAIQFPEYLVADRDTLGKSFADNGMNLVFTGHYHANDAVTKDFTSSVLTDVETGSLVTAPCPYRTVSLDVPTKTFTITTSQVGAIASHPSGFPAFASQFLRTGLTTITNAMLVQTYHLDATTAAGLTPLIVEAMMAHYAGDENIESLPEPQKSITKATLAALTQSPDPTTRSLGGSILSLWTDPLPGDNSLVLKLKP